MPLIQGRTEMNGNRQMEVHYINTGFPYTTTESFMDFFEGLNHQTGHFAHPCPLHDQEASYWAMNMHSYKFGLSGPGTSPYYDPYAVSNYVPRMDLNRSAWEYPVTMSVTESSLTDDHFGGNAVPNIQAISEESFSSVMMNATESSSTDPGANAVRSMQAIPEECSPSHDNASNSQVIWQDDIDPDNMTYEELLDLGEAIGTQSRGLSQELINSLPTSRYKSGGFFLRKRSSERHINRGHPMDLRILAENSRQCCLIADGNNIECEKRCVICQMRYKRGDKQINLPCKHVYHAECCSKWLSINKTCPICNIEVVGEESSH